MNFSLGIRSCTVAMGELQDLWGAFAAVELAFKTSQLACTEFILTTVMQSSLHAGQIVNQMDYQSIAIGRSCCIDFNECSMQEKTFLCANLFDCSYLESCYFVEGAILVSLEGLSSLAGRIEVLLLRLVFDLHLG